MIDPLDPLDPTTLRAARVARGLSQADLARAASVDATTILRIERGQDPRVQETWAPIVAALSGSPLMPSEGIAA